MQFFREHWGDLVGLFLIMSSVPVYKFVSTEFGQSFFAAGLLALKLRPNLQAGGNNGSNQVSAKPNSVA